MEKLTEKQLNSRLKKYYLKHYGDNPLDEWWVNPSPNKWKFERDGKIIVLTCNEYSGKVTEN